MHIIPQKVPVIYPSHLNKVTFCNHWYVRSRRCPTNFNAGRLHPEVQPLTLLKTMFHEKGTPFVYLLLTNGTPFTYLV